MVCQVFGIAGCLELVLLYGMIRKTKGIMLTIAMLSTASTGTLHKFCQCLHNEEEGEESSAHDPVTPIDAMPSIHVSSRFETELRARESWPSNLSVLYRIARRRAAVENAGSSVVDVVMVGTIQSTENGNDHSSDQDRTMY